jgi:osmoprotectant transport system permease protein
MKRLKHLILLSLIGSLLPGVACSAEKVTIGSKAFPESWILGEALKSLASGAPDTTAEHRKNLGGTDIVYAALKSGSMDIYPEYTGTVSEAIMKAPNRPTEDQMRQFLKGQGIGMSRSLGFNDGYALAVPQPVAKKYGLNRLSDLEGHPELRLGLSHEFLGRKDGWPGLRQAYDLNLPNVRGFQHELAYRAVASRQIDVIDIYTTDPEIQKLHLKTLQDDKGFFPRYDAVLLYRLDLPGRAPKAFARMAQLEGKITEAAMIRANAEVAEKKKSAEAAASGLLKTSLGTDAAPGAPVAPALTSEILRDTLRHLQLVLYSLAAAILIGIPLGVLSTRSRAVGAAILSFTGLLQTIPSLALLAFMIPLLGIGFLPSLVALFLYSLLPIVRNTYTGLETIPPALIESAEALGLSPLNRLLKVRLPMASPSILAGIKTSAVINVGTATLAALIGAGGLGQPILQGITLTDNAMILQGAVPAALLALLVQGGFDLLERVVIPRGLRL